MKPEVKPEVKPEGYESVLGDYQPQWTDGWCGETIGWGFRIREYLSEEKFENLRNYGSLECGSPGNWTLITKWLTPKEASEKYGEITLVEQGPRGGFRGITFGSTKFVSHRLRPDNLTMAMWKPKAAGVTA